MKTDKFIYILLALFAILAFVYLFNKYQDDKITKEKSNTTVTVSNVEAEAFLAKETNSTNIAFEKNMHKILSPASLTKVMTAVLAVQSDKLDDVVTITSEATSVEPYKLGAKVGDEFIMRELLIATLVSSSNDAAMAIGVHLGGSSEGFARMMNAKAKELGMKDTHFTNPCGLDIGENVSSAYDLMLLAQYAVKLPELNTIANYRKVVISNVDNTKKYKIKTHNKLLEYNPNAIGLKTGYTKKAGPCLIARAKKGDKDALLVILNSKRGARWTISREYFNLMLNQ